MPDAPIFVVGHARSGTTLLRLILNAHPRIAVPPEAHLVALLRHCESRYGPLDADEAMEATLDRVFESRHIKDWQLDPSRVRERCWAGEHRPAGIFAALMSAWAEKEGKPRWGEKTPSNYRHLPEIAAWFPDCQVIHIVRDPRDVAVSCLTPPFSDAKDRGDEYVVAGRWRDAVRRGRRAARELGDERYLELRYEDLTDDPETLVRRIAAFLGEDFHPGMLDYHRRATGDVPASVQKYHQRTVQQVDRQRVERWRKEASPEFVMRVEGIAGREMQELGYAPSGERPSASLRARIAFRSLRERARQVRRRLRDR